MPRKAHNSHKKPTRVCLYEREWRIEVERRIDEYEKGQVILIPLKKAFALLEQTRKRVARKRRAK